MEKRVKNALLVESEVLAHDPVALITLIDNAGGYAKPGCDSITMEFNNRSSSKMHCANAFRQNLNSSEFDVKPRDLHIAETAFGEFNPRINSGQFISFAYYPEQTTISELGFYNGKVPRKVKQRLVVALAAGRSMWPDQSDFQIQGVMGCFPEQCFDPDVPDGVVATILNGYFSALFGVENASQEMSSKYYNCSSGWINQQAEADFQLSALYKGTDRERIKVTMAGGPAIQASSGYSELFKTKSVSVSRSSAVA